MHPFYWSKIDYFDIHFSKKVTVPPPKGMAPASYGYPGSAFSCNRKVGTISPVCTSAMSISKSSEPEASRFPSELKLNVRICQSNLQCKMQWNGLNSCTLMAKFNYIPSQPFTTWANDTIHCSHNSKSLRFHSFANLANVGSNR